MSVHICTPFLLTRLNSNANTNTNKAVKWTVKLLLNLRQQREVAWRRGRTLYRQRTVEDRAVANLLNLLLGLGLPRREQGKSETFTSYLMTRVFPCQFGLQLCFSDNINNNNVFIVKKVSVRRFVVTVSFGCKFGHNFSIEVSSFWLACRNVTGLYPFDSHGEMWLACILLIHM